MVKFVTNQEIFDEIFDINYGDFVTVIDETMSEGFNFLTLLLGNYLKEGLHAAPIFINWKQKEGIGLKQLAIPIDTLVDLSIAVNSIRRKASFQVLVHGYLADVMIMESPDNILRLVEQWKRQNGNFQNVEFFPIPKGLSPDFEKKFLAIMDGAFGIDAERTQQGLMKVCSPLRGCKAQYSLQRFPYAFEQNRLLIQWKGNYIDKLPPGTEEALRTRVEFYKMNLGNLKLMEGEEGLRIGNPSDWLLPSYVNKTLFEIGLVYFERLEEVLAQIAEWEMAGIVRVERMKMEKNPPRAEQMVPKPAKRRIDYLLSLPYFLTRRLMIRKRIRRIAADVYLAERRSILEFIKLITAKYVKEADPNIDIFLSMERKLEEAVARTTFVERVRSIGESPFVKLDLKFFDKIVRLTIQAAFGIDGRVQALDKDRWVVHIPGCFLCTGLTLNRSFCTVIEGGLVGALSLTFKERFTCTETDCKAKGDKECSFLIGLERSMGVDA